MKKLISAYLDNEVSEKEKNLVEEHLKKCTFCRKYCENLRKLSSALNKYIEEDLSPDLEQRIKKNFLGEKYKGVAKMKNKKLIFGISSGALAILIMFVFVGHIYNYAKRSVCGIYNESSGVMGSQYSSDLSFARKQPRAFSVYNANKARSTTGNFPAITALNGSKAREYEMVQDDEPWITTTDNSSAGWRSGIGGNYQSKPLSVAAIKSAANELSQEGPIVIVEPYLPATGKEDKLIRNADATLEVKDIQKVYDEIVKIGKGKNGYLAAANFNESANGRVNAQIILRVPKEKFEETIDEVRKLGQVKRFDIHSVDVSQDYNALVSELNTIKTVYDKIADKLKEKKTDIQQAIRLESELTPIAKRIAAIRNKISEYDNLISVSTITINLYEVSWKLMIQESVKETKQRFVAFVSSLLKNSITLLPLLVIICVVVIVCVVLTKKLVSAIKNIFTKKTS
jgi:gas vesicle protein